jgi:hypothetical protein
MPAWLPMFALPNIRVIDPVEIDRLAIMYADDERVAEIEAKYPNFKLYLSQFSTEFEDKVRPSLLMWNDAGPERYKSTEALAAFRDALALSVVPYIQARILPRDSQFKMRFTNWFSIYPWMVDKNYEYVVMRSSAVMGLHKHHSTVRRAWRHRLARDFGHWYYSDYYPYSSCYQVREVRTKHGKHLERVWVCNQTTGQFEQQNRY